MVLQEFLVCPNGSLSMLQDHSLLVSQIKSVRGAICAPLAELCPAIPYTRKNVIGSVARNLLAAGKSFHLPQMQHCYWGKDFSLWSKWLNKEYTLQHSVAGSRDLWPQWAKGLRPYAIKQSKARTASRQLCDLSDFFAVPYAITPRAPWLKSLRALWASPSILCSTTLKPKPSTPVYLFNEKRSAPHQNLPRLPAPLWMA